MTATLTPNLSIRLGRLELIAATPELLQAEDDLQQLARCLQADVPGNWPMPLYDHDARQHFLRVLNENPESVGWTAWYILRLDDAERRTLIGSVGACGLPDDSGTIVIGYSLLDQFHGQGYATEALRGFLNWVKSHPRLRRVVADTFPHLPASVRVLEKNGFVRCGAGTDEGSIRFELAETKRPVQFTLRTLLLSVSALAPILASVRWLGAQILPFILVAAAVWLAARTKARHLLVWLVPALWALGAFGSWRHPGDEYGLVGASMLVSIWLVILIHSNNLSQATLPLIAAGALPMAVFGFLLDRLPVSRRWWAAVYILASAALFAWGLLSFPSLERAIAKNGSILAYAFCAANLGMYASVLTCLSGGTLVWLWRRFRRWKQPASCPATLTE